MTWEGLPVWIEVGVWFVGLLGSWLGLLLVLASVWRWKSRLAVVLAVALLTLAVTIATSWTLQGLMERVAAGQWIVQAAGPIIVTLICGMPWFVVLRPRRTALWEPFSRRFLSGWAALISLVITTQYFVALRGDVTYTVEQFSSSLRPVENLFLRTDKGRLIPVYWSELAAHARRCEDSPAVLSCGYIIRRELPDPNYNCHGWLFAHGRFSVKGDDVEIILKDNGYYEVEKPAVGDIVIYRDEHDRILHSAVVRAILDDGTPMLESKWGFSGRFLHRPNEQVYSTNYHYYRTDRPAHGSDALARHRMELVQSVAHSPTTRAFRRNGGALAQNAVSATRWLSVGVE
jgi:hypothetical protein